ncbi:MAG: protein-disulfide isomerase [Bacteriovoracaceae bacterium]|jgi:protein-disulfide isomerase
MKKYSWVFAIVITALVWSCTKEAKSKASYVFKKAPDSTTAAKLNGKTITNAEITEGIEAELYEAKLKVHELKMNKLKAIVLEKLMNDHPKKKGLTNDQFLETVIASKAKVEKSDIDKFIKERNIPTDHINDQMTERIKGFLIREKKKQAIDSWVKEQTSKNPVEVYMTPPTRPVFDVQAGDAPFMGGADAKVTVIEFSDFQCPFCAKGAEIVNELKKKYGNKIKVAFKNYPLPFHNHAQKAAEAGLCVAEQNKAKFWEMHDAMFADQAGLAEEALKTKVGKLGLDVSKFTKCLSSGKFAEKVKADMEEGKKVGVKSTPTFFVNGMMINGAHPVEVFSELIDAELAK